LIAFQKHIACPLPKYNFDDQKQFGSTFNGQAFLDVDDCNFEGGHAISFLKSFQ
jgi:hypothetical protein